MAYRKRGGQVAYRSEYSVRSRTHMVGLLDIAARIIGAPSLLLDLIGLSGTLWDGDRLPGPQTPVNESPFDVGLWINEERFVWSTPVEAFTAALDGRKPRPKLIPLPLADRRSQSALGLTGGKIHSRSDVPAIRGANPRPLTKPPRIAYQPMTAVCPACGSTHSDTWHVLCPTCAAKDFSQRA